MHFDVLIFVALVLVAAFLRWISQQAVKAQRRSEQHGGRPTAAQRTQTHEQTDEERIRRFLEALGQPTSSKPPPKVARRPVQKRTVPRSRPILSPLPPLTTVPPDVPSETPVAREPAPPVTAGPPRVVEPRAVQPGILVAPQVQRFQFELPAEERAPVLSKPISIPDTGKTAMAYPELATLLKTERGLRDAIILREIFGPPRGVQMLHEDPILARELVIGDR